MDNESNLDTARIMPTKHAGGRPTKYQRDYPEKVYKLCLLGATNERISEILGITIETLNQWRYTYPELSDALTRGREDADGEIAKSLYHRAKGYSHKAVKIFYNSELNETVEHEYIERHPPDTAAAFIWLKNRHPDLWRDRRDVNMSGNLGMNFSVNINLSNNQDADSANIIEINTTKKIEE